MENRRNVPELPDVIGVEPSIPVRMGQPPTMGRPSAEKREGSGVKPPAHLPPDVAAVWAELTAALGDQAARRIGPEFEAYCGAVSRLRDAQHRIHDEELIVPDSKNAPIPHPAFAVERQAMDELRKWGNKFRRA